MTSMLRKHRRLLAASMLAAFLVAWILPAQACLASSGQAGAQTTCPDCPYPCDSGDCGLGMAACAASSMLPAAIASAPSLDKALPAAVALKLAPFHEAPRASLPARLDQASAYPPPINLNIRFCTFLE